MRTKKTFTDAPSDETVDEQVVAAETKDVVETRIQAAVDQWVRDHMRNSPFSRNTVAWNHFFNGLPALVQGITKEVKQA